MAVVADPDEKARAKLACSRAATARSKFSLEASQKPWKALESTLALPIRVRASDVLIHADRFAYCSLSEGSRKGNLKECYK